MDDGAPRRRARAALESLAATDDPRQVLDAARRLREAAEEIEQTAAAEARWAGTTWHEIGVLYGTTKQGAQQRFGKHLRRRPRPVPEDSAPRG
ncbi:hypothetical protein [Actinomycetospora sp. TBRC 11914]|uniref:hypothetical protein n=1 Tax=Actinomycetospora sp. TBRC 11914 TaxID=2729387 RepID=UPI00145D6EBC|nr:hypothetical protein [Actinomycetospora sp. TBRC 11914]NMO93577.1 hypothetical protein [Actinomycetospora sp. TBRC 11914]